LGIACNNGRLTLRRLAVFDNAGGGVSVTACSFDFVNNIIAVNGRTGSQFGGVLLSRIGATHTTRFEHNTVAENGAGTGLIGGVTCALNIAMVELKSSIFVRNSGTSQVATGGNCQLTDSFITAPWTGGTHVDTTNDPQVDTTFHLAATSPARGYVPGSTVIDDVDGEARPQPSADSNRDCGADERP
jgi:hypothetical protein